MTKAIEPAQPKLTLKQRRFLQEYFKSGNGVQSAMKVYDTKDYASACALASENLTKLKPRLEHMMEARGLDLGKLLGVLDEGLASTKVISAAVIGGDPKDADSQTNDFIDVPDYPTRHKYLETAGKWLGLEAKEDKNTPVSIQVNNFIKQEKENFGI